MGPRTSQEQQQMKTLSSQEHLVMLKSMLLGSIISADNDEYTEEVKQAIITRLDEEDKYGSKISPDINWDYVFAPLGDKAYKYTKIMYARD